MSREAGHELDFEVRSKDQSDFVLKPEEQLSFVLRQLKALPAMAKGLWGRNNIFAILSIILITAAMIYQSFMVSGIAAGAEKSRAVAYILLMLLVLIVAVGKDSVERVWNQRRMTATLSCLGATPRFLSTWMFGQAMVIGLVGSIVGCTLGLLYVVLTGHFPSLIVLNGLTVTPPSYICILLMTVLAISAISTAPPALLAIGWIRRQPATQLHDE